MRAGVSGSLVGREKSMGAPRRRPREDRRLLTYEAADLRSRGSMTADCG